jgi:hypothetical protein
MIHLFPANPWFTNAVLAGIAIATAGVAALPTLRWAWKAWPLVLIAAFAVPLLSLAIVTLGLFVLSKYIGAMNFVAEITIFVLVGLPSALSGFAVVLLTKRFPRKVA